jgi:hypothetical protein
MTEKHPITPPPELRRLWAQQAQRKNPRDPVAWQEYIAAQAARWGADQELEACCEWLVVDDWKNVSENLRAFRRPKPPSLKPSSPTHFYLNSVIVNKFPLFLIGQIEPKPLSSP